MEVSNSTQAIQGVVNSSKLAKAEDANDSNLPFELDNRAEASEVLALQADVVETDRLNSAIDQQGVNHSEIGPDDETIVEAEFDNEEESEFNILLEEMLNDED